jgi:hypothetical protein
VISNLQTAEIKVFMANELADVSAEKMGACILTIRGQRVMLDSDLAEIYGVSTKHLNQQFRRNLERFPDGFAFELESQEVAQMRSQIVTSSRRNLQRPPIAFTEHGAIMLAMVLKSPVAAQASIRIVRAFIFLREQLAANKELARKVAELENQVGEHDGAIKDLFEAIRQLIEPPAEEKHREIGFHIRETAPPYRVRTRKRF